VSRVTSTRMYNAAPAAAAAWRELFARVFAECEVQVEFLEHGYPTPIDELWRRPGLFGAFMCGWPFTRADRPMQVVAAPVPSPGRYGGAARYRSEFLVRAVEGASALEDTFGKRIGWMARDSQSGYNAPRHHLSSYAAVRGAPLFAESKGPFVTPLKTLEALRSGEVDVVALDSYFLDLLRRHAPERMDGLATVAETRWTPIPLVVAAPDVDAREVEALRARLLELGDRAEAAPLLDALLLRGFTAPVLAGYAVMERMAGEAAQRGYAEIM
jgi:ABC-type phosphate/phosphonate transport system substrate-binding protein